MPMSRDLSRKRAFKLRLVMDFDQNIHAQRER